MATRKRGTSPPRPVDHVLDVYGAHLHLAWSKAQWRTLTRRFDFLDQKAPQAAGMVSVANWVPKGPGLAVLHLVVWIDLEGHQGGLADLVDTVAHESSHAAGALLEHIGHQPRGIDEPHAYLVGWLAGWVWRHLSEPLSLRA